MTTTGKVLTGFIVGATTGALLGVLFAPRKGAKTRALISEKANQVTHGLTKGYEQVRSTFGLGQKASGELAAP